MFRSTTIVGSIPNTAQAMLENLQRSIGTANRILDTELLTTRTTDIQADWSLEASDEQGIYARLSLYTLHRSKKVGVFDIPLEAEVFADEDTIRQALYNPVSIFNRTLLQLMLFENSRQHKELEKTLLLAGAV
ncbi:MAG: hypothetical protein ACRC8S_02125 [Fimbriiglobus sp.]